MASSFWAGVFTPKTRRITGRPLAFWMRTTRGRLSPAVRFAEPADGVIETRNTQSPRVRAQRAAERLSFGGRTWQAGIKIHSGGLRLGKQSSLSSFGRRSTTTNPSGRAFLVSASRKVSTPFGIDRVVIPHQKRSAVVSSCSRKAAASASVLSRSFPPSRAAVALPLNGGTIGHRDR